MFMRFHNATTEHLNTQSFPLDETHLNALRELSNYEVSTSASTRRARRSNATRFEQNKWIFLSTLPRTIFNTEVFGYLNLS